MNRIEADKPYREKAGRELLKNALSYNEEILDVAFQKTAEVRPPTSHL